MLAPMRSGVGDGGHLPCSHSRSQNDALRYALDIARGLWAGGYRILRGSGIEFFVRFGYRILLRGDWEKCGNDVTKGEGLRVSVAL